MTGFKFRRIARVLTAAATVAASTITVAEAATELKLAGVHSPNSFETQALNRFAELVEEKTEGEVVLTVYPAGQLGDERSMIDMLGVGAVDMFANVADWNQQLSKDFAILSMPFTFRNREHLESFLESDTYARMKTELLDEHGVRVIADNWYRLPRVLITKEEIQSMDDLEGKKLRMADIESFIKTWQAFGAKPTVLPFSEAYLALKTGIVDGMESPLSSIFPQKFYQVAPHITVTNHGLAPFNILMNEQSFQQLGDDQQAVLDAGEEAGAYYTSLIESEFKTHKEKMLAEGAEFHEIPLQPFVESAREVAADFEERGYWSKGLFEEIQQY